MSCCHPSWDGNIGGCLMVYTNTDLHCFQNPLHNHNMSLQKRAIGHMPRDYASKVLKQTSTVQRVVDYPMEKEKEEEEEEEEVDCHSVPALDVPLLITGNMSFHDDEMMSWLMYPSDGTFDRPYGSDLFGDLINPHLHLVKDVFIHQTMKESETKTTSDDSIRIDLVGYESEKTCDDSKRVYPSRGSHKPNDDLKDVNIDGHESEKANDDSKRFSLKVHGLDNTCESSKKLDLNDHESEKTSDDSKRLDLYGCGLSTHMVNSMDPALRNKKVLGSNPGQLEEKRIPSLHPCEEQNEEIHYKFPLFSRPVAATRDSLRILGAESGPTNIERARKPLSRDLVLSSEVSSSIHNSCPDTKFQRSEAKKTLEESNTRCLKSSLTNNHSDQVTPRGKESSMGHSSEGLRINRMAECEQNPSFKSDRADHISGSTTVLSECRTGMVDMLSSPSMISASINPSPTRFCSNEESQDVEDVITIKKPPSHLKRNRAAEIHNESEKRRRDRINVKLKALQDLIPNSTKTDKASILDDAIKYLKMLQAQVQFMSTRSNFVFPPVMMPAGLQCVPMQGISTLPQMGVRDMIGPHQPVIQLCPMPPWQPLQAYHGTQIVHALSPIVQAPPYYLPASMPTQFEMQRNMRSNVSMQ